MTNSSLPRSCEKALADLCRFGRLERLGDVFAATKMHLPELGHEPRAITALINDGFATREDDIVKPTASGHQEQKRVEALKYGGVA